MTRHNPEVLSDAEMADLLRSLETHSRPNSDDHQRLLDDMLAVFDGVTESNDPPPDIIVIEDKVDQPRRTSTKRGGLHLVLAAAAALAFVFWISRPSQPTTAVTASETTGVLRPQPTLQPDESINVFEFSNFAGGVRLPVPDGVTVVEEVTDSISFARSGVDSAGAEVIALIATGTTDVDKEIQRLADEGVIVVNDSRVRVGGELRSRWEVTISNATATELGCAGINKCLTIPTAGADIEVWSGVPTIITSLEVSDDSHAAWVVRLTSYQDARGRTISQQMLNGLRFD